MKIKPFTLLLLSFICIGHSQGAENDVKVVENTAPLESEIENVAAPLNPEVHRVIESPIVNKEEKHGQLFRFTYDAEHLLFPVKIISVDGWLVTEFVSVESNSTEQTPTVIEKKVLEILLAPGEHQMKVVPDFDYIEAQTVFMGFPWQEKHIRFSLTDGQQIAVAARLLNVDSLEWALQLYRVEIPPIELQSDDTETKKEQLSNSSDIERTTTNSQLNKS